MNTILSGVVVSSQLGRFGNPPALYGFIAVETENRTVVKVKIDAYTDRDDFDIGDTVQLEVAPLGETKILVVKRIHKIASDMEPVHESSAVEIAPGLRCTDFVAMT